MKLNAVIVAMMCASNLFAKTVYVDCKLGDYSQADGKTAATAYETLQQAYNSASSGDEIEVARGVYDKGEGGTGHWWGQARIKVGDKTVRFYAPEGASNTVIEGAYGDDAGEGTGFGSGALKCVISEGNKPAIFEGFTLRKGRVNPTSTGSHASNVGGAVHASVNGTSDWRAWPYFVDCVVEDCDGVGASVAWGGTFVRCTFRGNSLTGAVSSNNYFARHTSFLNCVFTGNIGSRETQFQDCTLVNNTLVNNGMAINVNSDSRAYNNLFGYNKTTLNASAADGNLLDGVNTLALVDPSSGDIHWRNGAAESVLIGNARYLGDDYIAVTGGVTTIDKYLDIEDVGIQPSGTVAAGAVQTGVDASVSGAIEITTPGIVYDGRELDVGDYVTTSRWPELLTFTFNTNNGERVVNYVLSYGDTANNKVSPMLGADDPIKLLPPKDVSKGALKLGVGTKTSQVVWTDPKAEAGSANGTKEHPFTTLKDAIESLTGDGAVIVAKAGTYEPGPNDEGVINWSWNNTNGKGMIVVARNNVRIVGESGAARTILKGRKDLTTQDGTGANAVSGGGSTASYTVLQGFTVTGCYGSSDNLSDPFYSTARALFYTYSTGFDFVDCVVSNNVSAGYVLYGRAFRTIVRGNSSFNGVMGDGMTLCACSISGNTVSRFVWGRVIGGDGMASSKTRVYSCTVAENVTDQGYPYYSPASTYAVNTIMTTHGGTLYALAGHYGCVYDGFTTYEDGGYLRADPQLTDPANGDLRLLERSPAVGKGVSCADDNAKDWLVYAPWDVYGNMIAMDDKGNVTPGALSERTHAVYVSAPQGGIEVVGGKIGVNLINPEQPLVIRAAAGTRPVAGLVVNGVTNLFETLPDHRLSIAEAAEVSALYLDRWYASVDGLDSAFGYYPSCAKSLQGALATAVAGDTVVAMTGTYSNGTMIQPNTTRATYTIPSRAVVKSGVTLVSESGRDKTIIEGAAATDGIEEEEHGLGANAIRCVYLGDGARIVGFTLRNGHTRKTTDTDPAASQQASPETTGGGVWGADRNTCVVEDCIIQDCAAYRGGNAFAVTLSGCITERGNASYIGGGLSDGIAYNTVSRNNTRQGSGYHATGLAYMAKVESCTVLDQLSLNDDDSSTVKNTTCKGTVWTYRRLGSQFHNCVFQKGAVQPKSETFDAETDRVVEIESSEFGIDDEGRISPASKYLVDKADATLDGTWASDCDAFGGQRVYNGVRDIGASEADWRGTYAGDLHCHVVGASPTVTESAAKTIELENGSSIVVNLRKAKIEYHCDIKVPGGVLTVKAGEDVVSYTTDQTIQITVPSQDTSVTMAYSGEGAAELGRFVSTSGMCIIFR